MNEYDRNMCRRRAAMRGASLVVIAIFALGGIAAMRTTDRSLSNASDKVGRAVVAMGAPEPTPSAANASEPAPGAPASPNEHDSSSGSFSSILKKAFAVAVGVVQRRQESHELVVSLVHAKSDNVDTKAVIRTLETLPAEGLRAMKENGASITGSARSGRRSS